MKKTLLKRISVCLLALLLVCATFPVSAEEERHEIVLFESDFESADAKNIFRYEVGVGSITDERSFGEGTHSNVLELGTRNANISGLIGMHPSDNGKTLRQLGQLQGGDTITLSLDIYFDCDKSGSAYPFLLLGISTYGEWYPKAGNGTMIQGDNAFVGGQWQHRDYVFVVPEKGLQFYDDGGAFYLCTEQQVPVGTNIYIDNVRMAVNTANTLPTTTTKATTTTTEAPVTTTTAAPTTTDAPTADTTATAAVTAPENGTPSWVLPVIVVAGGVVIAGGMLVAAVIISKKRKK